MWFKVRTAPVRQARTSTQGNSGRGADEAEFTVVTRDNWVELI